MRVWLGTSTLRILPWGWLCRNSSSLPVNVICRAVHIMMKYEITGRSDTLSNLCTRVSSTFSHKTVTTPCVSVHNDYLQDILSPGSREHRRCSDNKRFPVIEEVYNEVMTMPKWLTADEWSAVGLRFNESSFLSAKWPTILLHFILHKTEAVPGLYSVGMSLVDYIASFSDQHRLLRLVSAVAIHIHQGGENEHEKALALYDELCAEYELLDHGSAHILITALARTRYWRRCIELVDIVKIASEPTSKDYSPIIVAALRNQDDDLASELLATLSRSGFMPDDEVVLQMLASGTIEKVLATLRKFSWIPSRSLIESVVACLQSQQLGSNLMIKETKIAKNGFCKQCGDVLEPQPRITNEEFLELRREFMNKSLIRDGNVFLQSSPEELSAFRQFLEQHQSRTFTVAFDGLNIAKRDIKSSESQVSSAVLEQAISIFVQKGHSVLVFGRRHMMTWKVYQHCRNAHTSWFFTQNVSSDDPFMLYAALYFGPETFIVTNDELRDHRHVLGHELAARLKLWQRQRQITFSRNYFTGKFRFNWPNSYNTVVQQSASGWHVPFDDGSERSSYSLPDAWYCIRNKMSRQ